MIEDKLTPEQRIRLEALAQANTMIAGSPASRVLSAEELADSLLEAARRIAEYLTGE